jgi:hypothetical protein
VLGQVLGLVSVLAEPYRFPVYVWPSRCGRPACFEGRFRDRDFVGRQRVVQNRRVRMRGMRSVALGVLERGCERRRGRLLGRHLQDWIGWGELRLGTICRGSSGRLRAIGGVSLRGELASVGFGIHGR